MEKGTNGFGLVEVLIAAAILSVVLYSVSSGLLSSFRSAGKIDSSADFTALRLRIAEGLNCSKTLPSVTTPPCVAGTYLGLIDHRGNVIVPAAGLKVGHLYARARCESGMIDVRAAWVQPGAPTTAFDFDQARKATPQQKALWFKRDEMASNLLYDWDHPKSQIFQGSGASGGVCQASFGAAKLVSVCGASQYIAGVDFALGKVTCQNLPACSATEAVSWTGSSFTCKDFVKPTLSALSSIPFDCFSASKRPGGSIDGGGSYVKSYSDSVYWGLKCVSPYSRTGCAIASNNYDPTTPGDADVKTVNNACVTDNDEAAANALITVICCKHK